MQLFDATDLERSPPSPAVRVNGIEIPRAAITREIQNHPAPNPGAARRAATQALAVRELLLQRARELGLEALPQTTGDGLRETQEEALIRVLFEREVAVPTPTEDECRRFYERHAKRFRSPAVSEAAHILFSAAPLDRDGYAAALEAARAVIAELEVGETRFEDLARRHSDCPSASQGGNLGQISAGQTAPEFDAALETLTPGEICAEPVPTRYGVHVVRLGRRIAGRNLPFSAVKGRIADYLADAVFHRAVHQYVRILAGKANIEGVDMPKADSPLVQ